jgi:predicted small lipoprotein YifL
VTASRPHRSALPLLALVTLALCGLAGCGKKGPPRLPLALVPARIDDVVVRRLGDEVQLQFTVPEKNTNGTTPADITAIDVLALTGEPVDQAGRPLGDVEFAAAATVVRSLAIQPPPPPEKDKDKKKEKEGGAGQAAPPRPAPRLGPAQGERVTVVERLLPELLIPATRQAGEPGQRTDLAAVPAEAEVAFGPAAGPVVRVPSRYYAVGGRSRRGRPGPLSRRVALPLVALPPAPEAPRVTYDEKQVTVSWTGPAGIRQPVQPPAPEGLLEARALVAGSSAHTYNVYAIGGTGAAAATAAAPANASPLSGTRFDIDPVPFGEERCFLVRTVERHGQATVESAPSPVTCTTPRDTFPPAVPRNLAAVGAEGAVNLIWEASGSADLAGYLVLRGEATGGALQVVTPEPVHETTFRDAAVKAGVRYVYAVVAVDAAQPPNRSAESNRVEETAR